MLVQHGGNPNLFNEVSVRVCGGACMRACTAHASCIMVYYCLAFQVLFSVFLKYQLSLWASHLTLSLVVLKTLLLARFSIFTPGFSSGFNHIIWWPSWETNRMHSCTYPYTGLLHKLLYCSCCCVSTDDYTFILSVHSIASSRCFPSPLSSTVIKLIAAWYGYKV